MVSIGLPVFNGENYLDQSVRSIVQQTFEDWELIIADNASTDATSEISLRWAQSDDRIQYHRQPENLGAARNFNYSLESASGRYLKWQAHDDICGPRFLEISIDLLERDSDTVLAYPTPQDIDESGHVIGLRDAGLDFAQDMPCSRFRAMTSQAHACLAMFGVFRREVFDAGVRHGEYVAADRVLLAELALAGKLVEIPELEYFHREHAERYSQRMKHEDPESQARWFSTSTQRGSRSYPHWQRLAGYSKGIRRAAIDWRQRACCAVHLGRWTIAMSGRLLRDLI